MTEKPIIFSAPMVRALLDGTKSQTRRIVDLSRLRVRVPRTVTSDLPAFIRPALIAEPGIYRARLNQNGAVAIAVGDEWLGVKPGEFHFVCPYGEGDTVLAHFGPDDKRWTILTRQSRLWVRETFCYDTGGKLWHRASCEPGNNPHFGWTPSIYMRRSESRILLEVGAVRMERLQQLSLDDARAEGIPQMHGEAVKLGLIDHEGWKSIDRWDNSTSVENYSRLWDELNAKRAPWSSNPWIWVLDVAVLEPAHARGALAANLRNRRSG